MNDESDQVRYRYFRFLKGRVSDKTLDAAMRHLVEFETFNRCRDLVSLTETQAIAFRDHVQERPSLSGSKGLSASSIVHTLSDVKAFFDRAAAEYFAPSNRMRVMARTGPDPFVPTPENLRTVIAAIPSDTLIGRRDRALIAFIFLTGIRNAAVVSLRIKHLNLELRLVTQHAREVGTKIGKNMLTSFFPVGVDIERIVIDWVRERVAGGAGPDDPLFPATPSRFVEPLSAPQNTDFWKTTNPVRRVFEMACGVAGVPYFHPHSIRSALAILGSKLCKNREQEKVWSLNLSHEHVATTQNSYLKVDSHRQNELMQQMAKDEPDTDQEQTILNAFRRFDADKKEKLLQLLPIMADW